MKDGDPSEMGGQLDERDEDEDDNIRLRVSNSIIILSRTALYCSINSATTPSFIIFQILRFFFLFSICLIIKVGLFWWNSLWGFGFVVQKWVFIYT